MVAVTVTRAQTAINTDHALLQRNRDLHVTTWRVTHKHC